MAAIVLCFGMLPSSMSAQEALRRPISPEQPAWIIHIDVWNNADPQKIIDMVPDDIRPYVIFNISTSSSDSQSPDGSAIYDSWMKVCAQNRVWAMIQCASGAHIRMPEHETAAYEQYFKDYPNFLGFNFAEQFWDFGQDGWATFPERLQLFADLMPICHQYGGYLAVSFTQAYYSADMMPIAYMKRNEQMRQFLTQDPHHFLCFEKFTMKNAFFDIESNCLGAWLGGYAGQYGIRFDCCGWRDEEKGGDPYVRAAGAIPIAEHVMLTGQAIIDGPELITTEVSKEVSTTTDADGFTQRNWAWFGQYENINIDMFRKILDGTIRIPSRSEVIDRTKICIKNDIAYNEGISSEMQRFQAFLTPRTLFDALYRQDTDQGGTAYENHWLDNLWWMKRTGRYPAIPQVYDLLDNDAKRLTVVKKSEYDTRWPNINAKVTELNQLFPEEYTGDIFAGRHENGWVTYNPYQYDESLRQVTTDDGKITYNWRDCKKSVRRAQGEIPFQYNTCSSIAFDYAPYSLGIMREYADYVTLYLNNYTEGDDVEDVITVKGASSQPVVDWDDRASHTASSVQTTWENGELTLRVSHNGPLEITIHCSGLATGRKTAYTTAHVVAPQLPPVYTGVLQYEAELADYKSIAGCRKNGYNYGHAGYQGQGFMEMGTNTSGTLRFHTTVPKDGYYIVSLRYQATNDGKVTMSAESRSSECRLAASSEWAEASSVLRLSQGENTILVKNSGGTHLFLDCIRLEATRRTILDNKDLNGEFHVDLHDLIAEGSISFDPETGVVTQSPGSSSGKLLLLLEDADFTKVTSVKVVYSGDGDVFNFLRITDGHGNSANPSGSQQAFWSCKYNLDYTSKLQETASQSVCCLEWGSNQSTAEERTMTISDIIITMSVTPIEMTLYKEGKWNTLCLPFDMTADQVTEQLAPDRLMTLEGSDFNAATGTLTLDFANATTIEAGKPYIIKWTTGEDIVNPKFTGVTVKDASAPVQTTYVDFVGCTSPVNLVANDKTELYLSSNNTLYYPTAAKTIGAYHAYFRLKGITTGDQPQQANTFVLNFDGEATAIGYPTTAFLNQDANWYTVDGRRLSGRPSEKGIYIHHHRKVVIK